jgi:hypothetical protein
MAVATLDGLYTSTTDAITDLTAACVTAVSNLNSIGASWTGTSIGAITGVTLNSYSPLITALGNALTDIEAFTFDFTGITLGNLPSAPDIDPSYKSAQWSAGDTKWESVKTSVDAFINNITSADDLDTVVTKLTSNTTKLEVAMYLKDYEIKAQVLRDMYNAANNATGAKGFLYPNIITVALKLKAQQEFQFSLSESARELIKYLYEWAKTNFQFAIQQGISAHNADIDFNIRFAQTLVSSYTATITGVVETYKAEILAVVAKAKAEIEVINAKVDIMKMEVTAYTSIDDLKVKEYAVRVDDSVKRMEIYIKEQTSQIENKIKAYASAAQASASMATSSSQMVLGTI